MKTIGSSSEIVQSVYIRDPDIALDHPINFAFDINSGLGLG